MSVAAESVEPSEAAVFDSEGITLSLRPIVDFTDDQFFEFCRLNSDLRIETNEKGEIVIMPPVGGGSGERESEIITQLRNWAKRDGTGKTFSSATIFCLPSGARLSPDTSWVRLQRWNSLTEEQQEKFPPLCPDFIVELRSKTDCLRRLQTKLQTFIDNGAELGLLIDPLERKLHVYRPRREPLVLDDPKTVSCDPELPGFILDLQEIW